jgi:transposase-like protein
MVDQDHQLQRRGNTPLAKITFLALKNPGIEWLNKDNDALLTFYDFPADHWIHLRTTNPIESTFATVRLRTAKTRGRVSRKHFINGL